MFTGEYNHSLDSKGRIIVPAKYREDLGNEFIVTKGLDKCLWVFSNEGWNEFVEKLKALPKINSNIGTLLRHFAAGANSCELDKQGRILLPANLREYADLDKEVVLAGMLERVEIWSKTAWEESLSIDMTQVTEELQKLNITL